MRDFVKWCNENRLIDVFDDGTVTWKESQKSQKTGKHKEKFDGARDARKDLSADYKDYCHDMGTVWPFKIHGKKGSQKKKVSED